MRLLDVRPLILLSVLAIAVAGCTRKTSDNATVRLSFENGSGQTKAVNAMDESIQVVILNITGSGISAPVFFQWDSHGATGAAFPETITLSVPRGDSRLIQALVVKKDLAGLNTFYYNDVTQSIQGDNTDVTLTVVPLSTTASAGDASIAGRYLDANGTGPTSKIRVYLPIPNHPEKPQMLVDNSQEMIGGWFRVFSLDGARFQYLLADGRDLFGSPVGVDSDSLLGIDADSPRTMRVSVPSYYSTNGDITSPRRLQGASRSVYGFFGPGAANLAKQISYCGSTHPIAYAYIDATSNTTLRWNPAQASYVAATDAFIETVGTKRGGATGSAADANGLCAGTGLPFLDYLALADQQLTSHDQVLGFKGPFQIQYGGGQGYGNTITTSVAAGVLSAKVVFLPGTQTSNTAKGIDGVDLFGRIETGPQTNNDNADYKDNNDGVRCATLDHLASPFTYLDTKNANPDPNALTVQALDVTLTTSVAAFVAATQVTYIACPFLKTAAGEKIYFSSAAVAQSGNMAQPGPGGMPQVNLVHDAVAPFDSAANFGSVDNTQQNSSCKLYDLTLTMNGLPFTATSPMTINPSGMVSSSPLVFFSGSDTTPCTNSVTSVTIPQGASSARVYIRTPVATGVAQINLSNGSMAALYVVPASPITAAHLQSRVNVVPTTLVIGQCYPIELDLLDSSYLPTYMTSNLPLLSITGNSAGGTFYTNSDCSTALSLVSYFIPAYTSATTIYYSPGTPASGQQIMASANTIPAMAANSFYADSPSTFKFVPSLNNATGGMNFVSIYWWAPAGCTQVSLNAVTTNGGPINLPGAVPNGSVTIAATNGLFYTNSACTGGGTTTATYNYSMSGSSNSIYYANGSNQESFSTSTAIAGGGPGGLTVNFPPSQIVLQTTSPTNSVCTGSYCTLGALVSLRGPKNTPYSFPGSTNMVNLSTDASNNGANYLLNNFPSGGTCSGTSSTNLMFSGGGVTQAVSSICANIASPGSTTLKASVSFGGLMVSSNAITIAPSAAPPVMPVSAVTLLSPSGTPLVSAGVCEQIAAFQVDINGYWIYATGTGSGQVYLSGPVTNGLSTSSNCSPFVTQGQGVGTTTAPTVGVNFGSATSFYFLGSVANATSTINYSTIFSVLPVIGTLTLTPQ